MAVVEVDHTPVGVVVGVVEVEVQAEVEGMAVAEVVAGAEADHKRAARAEAQEASRGSQSSLHLQWNGPLAQVLQYDSHDLPIQLLSK